MADQLLLLIPLLILAVVVWLGFSGCSIIYDPDNLPELRRLSIRLRVPPALQVRRIDFGWTEPNGLDSTFPSMNPLPDSTEDGDNVFVHIVTNSAQAGAWNASCRLRVEDANGAAATRQDSCSFNLDGSKEESTVTFQASGTPTDSNFAVTCMGLT